MRRFIVEELGGVPPEQFPTPTQSIQQLQRAEQRRIEAEAQRQSQPSLFADTTSAESPDDEQ